MKKIFLSLGALVAAMILTVAGDEASANLIVGPPSAYYTGTVGGNASTPPSQPSTWGIQFTANKNSHLISFDFNQNGSIYGNLNAGTIALKDVTTSTTVDTWGVPVVPSYGAVANTVSFSGFDDILHSGDVYQLVYTQTAGSYSNEKFAYLYSTGNYTPYTNADITVNNGIENNTTSTGIWYAFSNIQTIPEPSTFAMLGLGTLVLAIRRRRLVA